MKGRSLLPISLNMVIHNEELVLERCLNSVKDIVDEMIILHDGPVEDRSEEIAKKFGAKFKVMNPWLGVAEPWRIDALKLSKHDWILQVDADEYFLSDQKDKFENIIDSDYDFVYVNYLTLKSDGNLTEKPEHRPIFYKKSKIEFVGAVNERTWPLTNVPPPGQIIQIFHWSMILLNTVKTQKPDIEI
jgi:glycosyltransferase involved in cell wall biosynthesis